MQTPSNETRHARRGLGPFTGGQLTAIVIVGLLAVALPAGAFAAVSGSNAFITDHVSGAHASVTPQGNLQTATIPQEGSIDAIGTVLGGPGDHNACAFYRVPTGFALIVTSIQFNSGVGTTGSTADQALFVNEDKVAACGSPYNSISGGTWTSSVAQQVVLDPGYAVPQKTYLDLNTINGSSSDYAVVFVYGYLIPASSCKTLCSHAARSARPVDAANLVAARPR
jgi:hypothetical protein